MSFIRPGTEPKWVDIADTEGLYSYSDGDSLVYFPTREEEFVEVVMRMLEQSGELDENELEKVFEAFASRLRWKSTEIDTTRNRTRSDAYNDMTTACAWMQDRDGWEEEYEAANEIWQKLDPKGGIEKGIAEETNE